MEKRLSNEFLQRSDFLCSVEKYLFSLDNRLKTGYIISVPEKEHATGGGGGGL